MAMLLFRINSIDNEMNETVLEDFQLKAKPLQQHLLPYLAIGERYIVKFFCELEETELLSGVSELVSDIQALLF